MNGSELDTSNSSAEVAKEKECGNIEELSSVLKSLLMLFKRSGLSDWLKSLKVEESKTCKKGLTVKWIGVALGVRGEDAKQQGPDFALGLSAYQLEDKLYEKLDKLRVMEGKMGLLERQVVAKIYECGLSGLNDALKEALLQIQAESKHTCNLLDISVTQGTKDRFKVEILMERLGGDLEADIKVRKPRDKPPIRYEEGELLRLLSDVTDALVYAKLRGVAHRDIKPNNIFQNEFGYKLGDFGSACNVLQKDSSVDGTLTYISPEMRRLLIGECLEVDFHQSDVFSLGVTMLHLATLTVPNGIKEAWKDATELEKAVERELEGLPYSLPFRQLLQQMLHMNPRERPQQEYVHDQVQRLMETSRELNAVFPTCPIAREQLDEEVDILLREVSQLYRIGRWQNAERILRQVLMDRHLLSDTRRRSFTIALACLYLLRSRYSESKALLEDILEEDKRKKRPISVHARIYLAEAYLNEGRFNDAEILLRESLFDHRQSFHSNDRVTVGIALSLGKVYACQGRLDESTDILEEVLSLAKGCFGGNMMHAYIQSSLGTLYTVQCRYLEGEKLLRESFQAYESDSYDISGLYFQLALNLLGQKKLDEAAVYSQIAIDVYESSGNQNSVGLMVTQIIMSEILHEQGDLEAAAVWRQKSLNRCFTHNYQDDFFPLLFVVLKISDKMSEAEEAEIARLCQEVLTTEGRGIYAILATGFCWMVLGNLSAKHNKLDEAVTLYEKSLLRLAPVLTEKHPTIKHLNARLFVAYFSQGNIHKARELLDRLPYLGLGSEEAECGPLDLAAALAAFINGNVALGRALMLRFCESPD